MEFIMHAKQIHWIHVCKFIIFDEKNQDIPSWVLITLLPFWPLHWLGSKSVRIHAINQKTLFMWSISHIWVREESICSEKRILRSPIWPWPSNFILTICTLWVKYDPDKTNGREDMLRKRIIHLILLWTWGGMLHQHFV